MVRAPGAPVCAPANKAKINNLYVRARSYPITRTMRRSGTGHISATATKISWAIH